ncbi:MAG: hypothetical protein A2V74_04375 [Acidobacteria bacterium RBG_16_70_10]|nr:MAG: hypothetical protein A2V74_04375 [Acidobacteria bacterium RBG_16_70_10]
MDETTLDRHRCRYPRCGRPFAVVYRRSFYDIPVPHAVACPHCGGRDVVLAATGAVREHDGTYVLPIGYRFATLEA